MPGAYDFAVPQAVDQQRIIQNMAMTGTRPGQMGRQPPPTMDPNFLLGQQANANRIREAEIAAAAQQAVAATQAGAQTGVANINAGSNRDVANIGAGADRYASDQNLAGTRYASDQRLREAQTAATSAQRVADIQAAASRFPHEQAMLRFNQVFPLLQGTISGMGTPGSMPSFQPTQFQPSQARGMDYSAILGAFGQMMPQSTYTPAMRQAKEAQGLADIQRRLGTGMINLGQGYASRGWSGMTSPDANFRKDLMVGQAANQAYRDTLASQIEYAGKQDDFNQRNSALLQQMMGQLLAADTSRSNALLDSDTSRYNALLGSDTSRYNAMLGYQGGLQSAILSALSGMV